MTAGDNSPTSSENSDATNKRQINFWDDWNRTWRLGGDQDYFMRRQTEVAHGVARSAHLANASILDVGCGTGWLSNELSKYGSVIGTDLSPEAINAGTERFPAVDLRCEDFMTATLPGPFDLVVSSDSFQPMPDHAACIARIASLQQNGGLFLLMTQNPFVWKRRSAIRVQDRSIPNGQVDQWPTKRRMLDLLADHYEIERCFTMVPGGDRGVLFWVENRFIRGGMGRICGRERWTRLIEKIGVGRELVIVSRRK